MNFFKTGIFFAELNVIKRINYSTSFGTINLINLFKTFKLLTVSFSHENSSLKREPACSQRKLRIVLITFVITIAIMNIKKNLPKALTSFM